MEFRLSTKNDIKRIFKIISDAQEYFKKNNIDQWQNGYPNEETILIDVNNGESYVLIDEQNIVGVCTISFRSEPTYNKIYYGNWSQKDALYGVIHRIAVESSLKKKGLGTFIFENAEKIALENNIKNLRVDTHEDNKPMQGLILKSNFVYRGIIYVKDGSKRLAFEKIL